MSVPYFFPKIMLLTLPQLSIVIYPLYMLSDYAT